MVLGGYFDESLRREGNEPISVAGYLFKPAAYVKFRRQWHRTVLRHGNRRFKHFHMTDLCAGQQQYKGMTIAERVEVLDRAVDAVATHSYGAIGIYFAQSEFESFAPPEWPLLFGSIYTAACQMCLQATGHWLKRWNCPMRVLYVFERGHKYQHEANQILTAFGNNDEARKRFQYKNHIFEEKQKEYGLQAADLFAWTVTKISLRKVPPALGPFMPSIVRLTQEGSKTGRHKLLAFEGDLMRRFFSEMVKPNTGVVAHLGPRKRAFK